MDLLNEVLNNFLARVMGAAPDIVAGLLVFTGFWVASGIVRRIFGHLTGRAEDQRHNPIVHRPWFPTRRFSPRKWSSMRRD